VLVVNAVIGGRKAYPKQESGKSLETVNTMVHSSYLDKME
jgi:hypothetical protein